MNNPRRLHPLAILRLLAKALQWAVPAAIALLWQGSLSWAAKGGIIVLFLLGAMGVGTFQWLRKVYYVEENEFHLKQGGWFKKHVSIPLEQIQAVESEQPLLHRLVGLYMVRIETASGKQTEAVLEIVTEEQASALKEALMGGESAAGKRTAAQDEPPCYRLSGKWLLYAGMTSEKIWVTLFFPIIFLLKYLDQVRLFFTDEEIRSFSEHFLQLEMLTSLLWFIPVILLAAWAISIAWMGVLYYRFQIKREGDHIYIEYGLLHTRKFTVPVKRIQLLRLEENWVRQWLGWYTLQMEVAGLEEKENKGKKQLIFFPLLPKRKLPATLLPEYTPYLTVSLQSPTRKTLSYHGILLFLGAVIPGSWDWPVSPAALLPAAV
ncbi:PH domain-containing protein [Laceyella putida]|uniref:PH domain-containing protein n=1 Tax=Laceyella putida TaxID=110101 RepID=A0ABW2RFY9_9BACL